MTPRPSRAVLLDISRLVSRVGGGPATGIDRVEKALLAGLVDRPVDLWGLCRTAAGFALIDRTGLEGILPRLDEDVAWGRADFAGRLSWKLSRPRRTAESDVRRLACGRSRAPRLAALLAERLPAGTVYLNVGHSNLGAAVMNAVRAIPSSRIAIMVHDVIPVRLPATQRPGAAERFRQRLATVAEHADLVICPSVAESGHVASALADLGRTPPLAVAPPGVDITLPGALPEVPGSPYFTAVGTLEPRKNIALLLDLWEHLAATRPRAELPGLCLIGRRGWESDAFFRRLQDLQARIPEIRTYPDLSDGARTAVVSGARGLLFPSIAEGYGLPPLEALAIGITPVCAPLPVYRETMADAAVYADPYDMYQWQRIVDDLSTGEAKARSDWRPPSWGDHVNKVLATIA